MQEIYEAADKQLERLEKELIEFEGLKSTDNLNEIDVMKLEDYISNWEFIFNHGTPVQKRNLIHSIANEVQVTKDTIKIRTEMDIPKFFEAITAIKHSAKTEIAASLEAQAVEASASSLQTVRSEYRQQHIAGTVSPTSLYNINSSDTHSSQSTDTEMQHLMKKLTKAFGQKVKKEMVIAS